PICAVPQRPEQAARDGLNDREPGNDLYRDRGASSEWGQIEKKRSQHEPSPYPQQSREERRHQPCDRGNRLIRHPPLYKGVMRLALVALVLASCTPTIPPAVPSPSPTSSSGPAAWRRVADIPTPRSEVAAAVFRGVVYVVGGFGGGNVVETYVYDTATDRWTTVAPIPTPRDHLAAAAVDGRVCAVGGRRLSLLQNLAVFECYDPTADLWRAMPDAPTARGGIGAAVIGSRMFVAGGEQGIGTFKEIDIFDASAGKWTRGPALPTSRHGLGVVAVTSTLYVMSGGPTPGVSQTAVCEALDVR